MYWSILIAGIPERYHTVQPLLHALLETQMVSRMSEVELIYFMDNRRRSVGEKRNDLLSVARGEYVSFIDDDDDVAEDYVHRIYKTIVQTRKMRDPADVICFRQLAHLNPHNVIHDCSYSLEYFRNRPVEQRRQLAPAAGPDGKPLPNVLLWTGPPAHTMVWRREVVKDLAFPSGNLGEDVSWVDLACAKATSEIQLGGEPIYHYRFSETGTSTR